jgi:hypothetical protein
MQRRRKRRNMGTVSHTPNAYVIKNSLHQKSTPPPKKKITDEMKVKSC